MMTLCSKGAGWCNHQECNKAPGTYPRIIGTYADGDIRLVQGAPDQAIFVEVQYGPDVFGKWGWAQAEDQRKYTWVFKQALEDCLHGCQVR